ncbi:hypothetical protein BDB00DRAFT_864961 [Zychaea mexicana]|uniref:uncharacterized protein n=1 Tax=Zychaea mexicana TaxID=64656 RepID=UPI0022FDEAFA|nr:uncharacterized protein BDB00DRAFT_864961 [Zychaea mexicana]KAI9467605.1 hypothetical protein BDB00DRAFT_864961 [Zychaea mexicana]
MMMVFIVYVLLIFFTRRAFFLFICSTHFFHNSVPLNISYPITKHNRLRFPCCFLQDHFRLIGRCSAIVTLHLCQFSDHFLQDKKYIIP